jgi:hypothetical protein
MIKKSNYIGIQKLPPIVPIKNLSILTNKVNDEQVNI